MPEASGSGSATIPGVAGQSIQVARAAAHFTTTPATGTLRIRQGTTTVFEKTVDGAWYGLFIPKLAIAVGEDCTIALTGGQVWMAATQGGQN